MFTCDDYIYTLIASRDNFSMITLMKRINLIVNFYYIQCHDKQEDAYFNGDVKYFNELNFCLFRADRNNQVKLLPTEI